jgi:hypothetical protein
MQSLVAWTWDGNESWLVLLALALWAGLPLVTGVALPALYIPLMLMLWSLIACGVANELIDQQDTGWHPFWGKVFGIGSLLAAFCQGAAFGGLIAGLNVHGTTFVGGPFTFLHHGYAVLTGLTAVTLYVLEGELGSSRHRRGQRACPQRRRRLAAVLRLTRGGPTHGRTAAGQSARRRRDAACPGRRTVREPRSRDDGERCGRSHRGDALWWDNRGSGTYRRRGLAG